ncbi:MAG: xanthine dehydrogenase family protein molybdopterin-binding subunit [Alphaproteobacteria bacterium]
MREFGLGQAVRRVEDERFVRGRGLYVGDMALPGMAHAKLLRSPHAAARLRRLDVAAAKAAPGVLDVLTGADAVQDGLGSFASLLARQRRDGSPNFVPPYRVLAVDLVRHVGEPVALVIAMDEQQAEDALELIEVDYEALPAVTETVLAAEPGQPAVWDEEPGNLCFVHRVGDAEAAAAAFARARHVVEERFHISRVIANPMETRAAIGLYDPRDGRYTLHAGLQAPHLIRDELAGSIFAIPPGRIRVVSPDVGGAFGLKASAYPELALVLWAARRVGCPVRWICGRSEAFLADHHARDNVSTVALALDEAGRFLGLRVRTTANLGAYLDSFGVWVATNNLGGLSGPYAIGSYDVEVNGVFTNTHATSAYRGAGRPEATYCIERIIDIAARQIGIDPVELRRRNMVPPSAMPYHTGFLYTYDSGAFGQTMEMALDLADWRGVAARRAAAHGRGKLYGAGLAYAIEIAGGPQDAPFEEMAEIRFDATGDATFLLGTHSHGQGHETVFRQYAVHLLGLAPERVRIVYGDTDLVYFGKGTFGSRSAGVGGAALGRAAEIVIEKGKAIAAHLLEVAADDLKFADGRFTVSGTDRSVDLDAVARAAFTPSLLPPGLDLGLSGSAIVTPPNATFPNGCHVCEVEIDPETGAIRLVRYAVIDDVGRVVNPLLLDGQIHGGVAQGAGQALFEAIAYDPSSGQLVSGSFMDYCMPRADDLPFYAVGENEVWSPSNPFGVKGAGEAGTVGSLPAVMNAVNDALAPLGIRHFDMPATPERLWKAIQSARNTER